MGDAAGQADGGLFAIFTYRRCWLEELQSKVSAGCVVRAPHGECERVFVVRRGDEVNVMAHQTVRGHLQPRFVGLLVQDVQMASAVIVGEEDILLIVAVMRDMMRLAGHDQATGSGHANIVHDDCHEGEKKKCCA